MVAEWDTKEGDELIEEIGKGKVITVLVGTDGSEAQERKARELCRRVGRQGGYWAHRTQRGKTDTIRKDIRLSLWIKRKGCSSLLRLGLFLGHRFI